MALRAELWSNQAHNGAWFAVDQDRIAFRSSSGVVMGAMSNFSTKKLRTYRVATNSPKCPFCEPKEGRKQKEKISDEERKNLRAANYAVKLLQKSNGCVNAKNYTGAKDNVSAECLKCGHKWDLRADHLLDRPYCPRCKSNKIL
jgi:predicted Zn-ribbon and HTH transcriptional regulator